MSFTSQARCSAVTPARASGARAHRPSEARAEAPRYVRSPSERGRAGRVQSAMKTPPFPRVAALFLGFGMTMTGFAADRAQDGQNQKAAVGGVQVAKVDINTADI